MSAPKIDVSSMVLKSETTRCQWVCWLWENPQVHPECIKTRTEEELKNIKYFCGACMAKGKMKTASVTPSHVDITRCEEEFLEVEQKDTIPVYLEQFEGLYLRSEHMILCNCNQCNGTKLTPARFESHTGSRRKNWKIIVKVKGTDMKLDELLNGKKPCVVKSTQRSAPITMKQKVEELLQEPYMPVHARWTTERCAICRWIEDWDYNKIIICNRCQVAVHQECYGATNVNDLTSWVCRACGDPKLKRNCCLCPIKGKQYCDCKIVYNNINGGALKRTDVGDFWVHVTCTWFLPKMAFPNLNTMEPAVGILSVPLDSFQKMCVICEQVHGTCTKCCECDVYYHAMCASRAGYCMECNGTKLTPARLKSHTSSRRKNWKIIVKVKGTDMKLDDLLNGKKPCVVKITQCSAPNYNETEGGGVATSCIKGALWRVRKRIEAYCRKDSNSAHFPPF